MEAVKWYRKAAEQRDAYGQFNLGVMYGLSWGVVKDLQEAYKWLLLSGGKGNDFAQERIPFIENYLTAAQRAEGQRLAPGWKPKIPQEAQ